MARQIFIPIFLLLTCLSLISCSPEEKDAPLKVNIGYLPMVSSLTYFVATENGYFMEEGIDIQARAITKSDEMALDLVNGNIDVAIELSITPLLKNDKFTSINVPYKIFSTSIITRENGFDGVLVKDDSVYTSLSDLSGKKIAVFPGTTAVNTFRSYFHKNLPDKSLPEFVTTIPISQQINALRKGEVDAVHAYEPALTIGISGGLRRVFSSLYADQLSPCPIGVAAVNKEFLSAHPEAVKKIIRAMDRAVIYIERNPEHARVILSTYTKALQEHAFSMNIMPMSTHGGIDIENLNKYLNILKEIGENKTNLKAEDLVLDL